MMNCWGRAKKVWPQHEAVELTREICKGGFAVVYEGKWKGAQAAVKRVHRRHKEDNEINIMSALNHPNIIKLYGVSRSSFVRYHDLIMEYAEWGSLFDRINHKHDPAGFNLENERVRIAQEIATGLDYLHKNRIIHRDIKPDNILLMSNGTVKIADFGFAVQYTGEAYYSRICLGTYRYLAPELLLLNEQGEIKYTTKVDNFGFGGVIYTMWHFRSPHNDTEDKNLICFRLLMNIQDDIPSSTPTHIKDLIVNLWSRDPSRRLAAAEIGPKLNTPIKRST